MLRLEKLVLLGIHIRCFFGYIKQKTKSLVFFRDGAFLFAVVFFFLNGPLFNDDSTSLGRPQSWPLWTFEVETRVLYHAAFPHQSRVAEGSLQRIDGHASWSLPGNGGSQATEGSWALDDVEVDSSCLVVSFHLSFQPFFFFGQILFECFVWANPLKLLGAFVATRQLAVIKLCWLRWLHIPAIWNCW